MKSTTRHVHQITLKCCFHKKGVSFPGTFVFLLEQNYCFPIGTKLPFRIHIFFYICISVGTTLLFPIGTQLPFRIHSDVIFGLHTFFGLHKYPTNIM